MQHNDLKRISAWESGELLPAEGAMEALYIHVPFCLRKCDYCDFFSEAGRSVSQQADYVGLLLREAELWRRELGDRRLGLRTVFIGGGTPTVLPMAEMRRLLQGLRAALPLQEVAEWTIEANPASVDERYLAMLRAEGVDRLSVGVQSFNDADLKWLGRVHDAAAAEKTLRWARSAGFGRLSIDLIFGLPQQQREAWQENLGRAVALGLTHISCYGLTYEEGTPLARRERLGQVRRASEEQELDLLRLTASVLERAGLDRYEISNFARPGEECRHNLLYWEGGNYLGLGAAAASHLCGARWRNRPDIEVWQQQVRGGRLVPWELEILSARQRAGELAMLMLRTKKGARCQIFEGRLRMNMLSLFEREIRRLVEEGLLDQTDDGIRLSQRGLEVADAVASEFLP